MTNLFFISRHLQGRAGQRMLQEALRNEPSESISLRACLVRLSWRAEAQMLYSRLSKTQILLSSILWAKPMQRRCSPFRNTSHPCKQRTILNGSLGKKVHGISICYLHSSKSIPSSVMIRGDWRAGNRGNRDLQANSPARSTLHFYPHSEPDKDVFYPGAAERSWAYTAPACERFATQIRGEASIHLSFLVTLASIYHGQGRLEEAEHLRLEVLEIRKRVLAGYSSHHEWITGLIDVLEVWEHKSPSQPYSWMRFVDR